jgi:hypothetical protein
MNRGIEKSMDFLETAIELPITIPQAKARWPLANLSAHLDVDQLAVTKSAGHLSWWPVRSANAAISSNVSTSVL